MLSFNEFRFSGRYEDAIVIALRLVLALIFIWFGVLKIFGYNPVFDLVHNSMAPFLAYGNGLIFLGVAETVIGLMLLLNRALFLTHVILALHLLGTFSTFIFGWDIVFDPHFPVLSLDGEFVIKNMTLVIAGLVVLAHESKKRRSKS
jgi:putative oxidoreductase